jgi:hypothetical protein
MGEAHTSYGYEEGIVVCSASREDLQDRANVHSAHKEALV